MPWSPSAAGWTACRLALELAASRLKLLPPAELLSRLESSLDLLQVSAVDRTDRQRTLRGAINWSYELAR